MICCYYCSEPIGLIVLELLESGELQKLDKRWWFDKGECVPEDSKVGTAVTNMIRLAHFPFNADKIC